MGPQNKHDEKRLAIMAELARRAEDNGTTRKFYGRLTPVMQTLMQEAGADAEEIMGLVGALVHYAASVGFGVVATPADVQFRTASDLAGVAGAMWDEACRDAERLVPELKKRGVDTSALEKAVKLAPSDPSRRPDIAPENTSTRREPENLADILASVNAPRNTDAN